MIATFMRLSCAKTRGHGKHPGSDVDAPGLKELVKPVLLLVDVKKKKCNNYNRVLALQTRRLPSGGWSLINITITRVNKYL